MEKRTVTSKPAKFKTREEGGEKIIAGYFAVFDDVYEIWDGNDERISPGAFANALDADIRALVNHNTDLVLGRTSAGTLSLMEDDKGLYGEIKINDADTDALNLYARVQRGDVSQCSFGFDILDEDAETDDSGKTHWTIKEVKLYEVSVVTFPAYAGTSVTARKKDLEEIKKRKNEKWKTEMKKRVAKWH